jgi:hypothetical protein
MTIFYLSKYLIPHVKRRGREMDQNLRIFNKMVLEMLCINGFLDFFYIWYFTTYICI